MQGRAVHARQWHRSEPTREILARYCSATVVGIYRRQTYASWQGYVLCADVHDGTQAGDVIEHCVNTYGLILDTHVPFESLPWGCQESPEPTRMLMLGIRTEEPPYQTWDFTVEEKPAVSLSESAPAV